LTVFLATADELRAEIMPRLAYLSEAGVLDLKALSVPPGSAKRAIPGVDQSGINGK
jgi:hypothetical protein